jgi:lipopolysaccharide biosynthesis glycosyltransferase
MSAPNNVSKLRNPDRSIAIAMGLTSDMSFAAGAALLSFADHHDVDSFKVYVFSDGMMPKLERAMRARGIDLEIIRFKAPVNWLTLWGAPSIRYFSPLVLSKFECMNLVSSHPLVIWMDYDVVVKGNLGELFQESFDFAYMTSGHPRSKAFFSNASLPENFDTQKIGMSAALLGVRNSFPDHQIAAHALYELFSFYSQVLYFPEQGVFDLFLNSQSFKVFHPDPSYYCQHPEGPGVKTAGIVHSFGREKFWITRHNEDWNHYYSEWIRLGGSRRSLAHNLFKKVLRMMRYLLARFLSGRNSRRPMGRVPL